MKPVQRKITLCGCVYYKGNPVQLLLKELWPLVFAFSLRNIVFATSPESFGDFDETWH
jgi:hypothetical protein